MGSFRGNSEILEVENMLSAARRPQTFREARGQDREQKPPLLKKGSKKTLEDDIHKLFEAVNLHTSRSLNLPDMQRNASKKPMKTAVSYSPGIGFSDPVSLKQALRGLCISQAAEMAAMKRLAMPASPRISETQSSSSSPSFSIKPIMQIMASNSGDFARPVAGSTNMRTSLFEGETTAVSDSTLSVHRQEPRTISRNHSAPASPIFPVTGSTEYSTLHNEIAESDPGSGLQEARNDLISPSPNFSKPDKKICGSNKPVSVPSKDSAMPLKVLGDSAPRPIRKSRMQAVTSSSELKGNKDVKSKRSTSRSVKTVIRNKNLIMKKSKKLAVSTGNSKTSSGVNGRDNSSGHVICQRCQCSLKDTSKDSSKDTQASASAEIPRDSDSKKPESVPTGWENRGISVIKTKITSKSCEKGDISQSSQSSICDFSSTTTSLSEESNLNGSSCGNRPHRSKDMRWEAINRIRKQYGFLGLCHFNLLKKLGSGDIGTVYLAELMGTNCPFAIKVMDNEFLARRKKMPRAQTEREILRLLDHPFLPTLYVQFTSDNLSCLVMEFCPGGDLHVLRQKQPGRYFPEQSARFYVAEVLLALEYLHMLGIVYRDLKPENILVREDGHIMLTDFDLSLRCSVNPSLVKSSSLGIELPRISGPCTGSNCIDPFCTGPSCKVSCFSPRLLPATARARKLKANAASQARVLPQLVAEPTEARSNSFVGTHEYLAPEIIKGEGHGSAVDWWTFGVFLYELLYGKTPFKGAGNEETLANVVLQNLKFPDAPIVSFQARDLIRGLLVKDPENRLGTATGAAEIKRHPFFEGLNWALIRCAVPPQIPELYNIGNSQMASQEKGKRFLEYGATGDLLEFELF